MEWEDPSSSLGISRRSRRISRSSDDRGSKSGDTARAAVGRRLAGVAQGLGVASVLGAGALWAFSMDRSPTDSPQSHGVLVQDPPVAAPPALINQAVEPWTFYIVASEEDGDLLRDALVAGNNLRNQMGLEVLLDEVLVVSSNTEAKEVAEALYEGNRIRAHFGVEDRVVNLVQ